ALCRLRNLESGLTKQLPRKTGLPNLLAELLFGQPTDDSRRRSFDTRCTLTKQINSHRVDLPEQKSEYPITVEIGIPARKGSEKIVQHTRNDTATGHSRLTAR